jgi:uncharacterized SAM-binding protein YcdF (DUF218 family)
MKRFGRPAIRALLILAVVLTIIAGGLAVDIWRYGNERATGPADAALVLGAAVAGSDPTPVLAERLRHAADLHARGVVARIVVTGGRSPEDALSEAEASRNWLVSQGVPAADILLEDTSRTTIQNIDFALPILQANGIGSVLIVSDPLHQRRAMIIAERRGLAASPSPTPTSRYQSLQTQLPFLMREVWFLAQFLVAGI